KQLKHWFWIADYYMCTPGEVFRAAVPSAFLLESETIITKSENLSFSENDLKDDEWLVFEALQHQPVLKIFDIADIIGQKNILQLLKRLLDKNVISVKEKIYEQYKPKLVRYVKLHNNYNNDIALNTLLNDLKRAKKQREAILSLFSISATSKKPVKV